VSHGIVDVFAYQEALLIEAVFGIALLTMLWIGFRQWLQHKDKMGHLIADQAVRSAQYGAQMECVEARLTAIEQILAEGAQTAEHIEAPKTAVGDEILEKDQPPPLPIMPVTGEGGR
jgi:hypothetical protein